MFFLLYYMHNIDNVQSAGGLPNVLRQTLKDSAPKLFIYISFNIVKVFQVRKEINNLQRKGDSLFSSQIR